MYCRSNLGRDDDDDDGDDDGVLCSFPLFDPALHLGCQSGVHSTSLGLKKSRKTRGASPRREL